MLTLHCCTQLCSNWNTGGGSGTHPCIHRVQFFLDSAHSKLCQTQKSITVFHNRFANTSTGSVFCFSKPKQTFFQPWRWCRCSEDLFISHTDLFSSYFKRKQNTVFVGQNRFEGRGRGENPPSSASRQSVVIPLRDRKLKSMNASDGVFEIGCGTGCNFVPHAMWTIRNNR